MTIIAYELTSHFPDSEKYGITSQIRRAAVSVVSNIAEGCARSSVNERRRFYEISRSSLVELDTQFEISTRLGFCSNDNTINLYNTVSRTFKLLSGMIKSC